MATTTHFSMDTTYEFKDSQPLKRRGSRADSSCNSDSGSVNNPTDGSLTYSSAASSQAGESTDSSFADILKVLEGPEMSAEVAQMLQTHPNSTAPKKDEKSLGGDGSLAYSTCTDAESNMVRSHATDGDSTLLHGADFVTTITGQPSDQEGDDHALAVRPQEEMEKPVAMNPDIMFSPAEHADSMKRRKDRKKQKQRDSQQTPPTKNTRRSRAERPPKSGSSSSQEEIATEDEDVWYAKWWMFCFPDTLKTMTPKR